MNFHDQNLRLVDLEVALTGLTKALGQAGFAPVVEQAVRSARSDGAKGAEDLLKGRRVEAPYRRARS